MCGKNRRLFPLHCHQWGLIYDTHRVESPIKSLFTVKRRDHQKQWRCFNCCWHRLNSYEIAFSEAHEAVFSKQQKTIWNSFCESLFCIPWIHLKKKKTPQTFILVYFAANRCWDLMGKTLFMTSAALSDTDVLCLWHPLINQCSHPPIYLFIHSVSASLAHECIVQQSARYKLIDSCKLLWCCELLIALLMGWVNYSEQELHISPEWDWINWKLSNMSA